MQLKTKMQTKYASRFFKTNFPDAGLRESCWTREIKAAGSQPAVTPAFTRWGTPGGEAALRPKWPLHNEITHGCAREKF